MGTDQPELFDVGERMPMPENPCTPARPGTGPQGATCRTCKHYRRVGYHDAVFLKCGLMENAWTHGPGSDIKAKWPACARYEKREGESSFDNAEIYRAPFPKASLE